MNRSGSLLTQFGLRADALPWDLLGGEPTVSLMAKGFYDEMERSEPELARMHAGLEEQGVFRVSAGTRERFAMFLAEWLGGPAGYSSAHGHPRLRMRHAHLSINAAMRDAWLRCMQHVMNEAQVDGSVRQFLDARFAEVADFLVNA
jgi:hemoglobin